MRCLKCGQPLKSDNRLGWCKECRAGICAHPGCGKRFLIKEPGTTMCPAHKQVAKRARGTMSGDLNMMEV